MSTDISMTIHCMSPFSKFCKSDYAGSYVEKTDKSLVAYD